MDRLIPFLVLLPFLVYFIIPVFMLMTFYVKRGVLSKSSVKIWSISFSVLATLSTFVLMVVSAQTDLAFNSGRVYLTEPLTQLSLASQLFGLFIINSIFTKESDEDWFQKVLKMMFLLGVFTYLIFSNQFLSVFLVLVALLLLAPVIKIQIKQILTGVIFALAILLYFLNLEFSKTFAEIRLSLLSGEVDQWVSLCIVFLVLIFIFLVTLTVVARDKGIKFFDKALWLLLSPLAVILCFYRLIQLGFISVGSIVYDSSQWVIISYLILFVFLIYIKRFSITGLILAASAGHTMLAMLFSLSGANDFSFSSVSIHYYMVSSIIFVIALYFINKMEVLKGADLELQDIHLISSSRSSSSFIVFSLILFISALPPGPLFLVTYSGVQSLIEVGLYWTTLWSLISLAFFGYFLFSSFSAQTQALKSVKSSAFELWKQKPENSVDFDFKEFVFLLVCVLALYGVVFLNL